MVAALGEMFGKVWILDSLGRYAGRNIQFCKNELDLPTSLFGRTRLQKWAKEIKKSLVEAQNIFKKKNL